MAGGSDGRGVVGEVARGASWCGGGGWPDAAPRALRGRGSHTKARQGRSRQQRRGTTYAGQIDGAHGYLVDTSHVVQALEPLHHLHSRGELLLVRGGGCEVLRRVREDAQQFVGLGGGVGEGVPVKSRGSVGRSSGRDESEGIEQMEAVGRPKVHSAPTPPWAA